MKATEVKKRYAIVTNPIVQNNTFMSSGYEQPLEGYLTNLILQGKPWLTFEGNDLDFDRTRAEPTASALGAIRFCNMYSHSVDPATGLTYQYKHRYHLVPNLLREYAQRQDVAEGRSIEPLVALPKLQRLMTEQDVVLADYQQGCLDLALGRMVLATRFERQAPASLIEDYYLLRHVTYRTGLAFDKDHITKALDVLKDADIARRRFDFFTRQLSVPPANVKVEMLLIGHYKNAILMFDSAGRPIQESGIVLQSAAINMTGEKQTSFVDPAKLVNFHRQYYTAYDEDKHSFISVDDKMLYVNPNNLPQSMGNPLFDRIVSPAVQQAMLKHIPEKDLKTLKRPRVQGSSPDGEHKLGL